MKIDNKKPDANVIKMNKIIDINSSTKILIFKNEK